jgi:iron complex outermembrane receptor protein
MKTFFIRFSQKKIAILLLFILNCFFLIAQPKPVESLTRADILSMSFDELSVYPLEDIMRIADVVGVSIDDLFNMLLNKDVSIASKHDESYFETPLSTSVLTAEDIERSGALSIPEALRLVPGIIVREKTNGNYDVHIRSSNNIAGQLSLFSENTMTLVMLDGRVVYTYTTGGTFWEMLPIGMSDIERIEVIRGAASAMYGANAVTGVINIITKNSASEKVSVEANVTTGGLFGSSNSPAVGGVSSQYLSALFNVNEKLKFRVSGNYNYRERTQSEIFFYATEPLNLINSSFAYYPVDSMVIWGVDPKMIRDPKKGMQAYGINGLMSYTINDDIKFDLTAGAQNSDVISTNLDLYFFAHTSRHISTQYVNLRSTVYGVNLQADYTWGEANPAEGIPGLWADMEYFNLNVDYNFRWNTLNINPGFYFAFNTLNSSPYTSVNQSYFSEKKLLRSFAPSVRLDYKPFKKLRFIGGLRLEKNKFPDKPYLTWQIIGNYLPHETGLIRAVYSRANRSPFMIDTHTDASVRIDLSDKSETRYTEIRMMGDKNLKLAVADMYELGYRQKIGKHILLNLELFHSRIKDLNTADLDELKVKIDRIDKIAPDYLSYQFRNIKEVQAQTGGTAEIGVVVNNNLNFRVWGTLQHTQIIDHNNSAPTLFTLGKALFSDYFFHNNQYLDADGYFHITGSDIAPEYADMKARSTPSVYGGYELNWQIAKKFSFFSNGYGFTKQTYTNQFTPTETLAAHISSKMLFNGKISYHFIEKATISISVNNILNDTSQEFGFMDSVGTQWYLGFNCKF